MHNPVVHFECFSKDPATLSNLYEKIFGWKVQDMAGLASPSSTTYAGHEARRRHPHQRRHESRMVQGEHSERGQRVAPAPGSSGSMRQSRPLGPSDAHAVYSQSGLARPHDGLWSILDLELFKNTCDVIANSLLGHVQVRSDLRVVQTLCNAFEYFTLAPGQTWQLHGR